MTYVPHFSKWPLRSFLPAPRTFFNAEDILHNPAILVFLKHLTHETILSTLAKHSRPSNYTISHPQVFSAPGLVEWLKWLSTCLASMGPSLNPSAAKKKKKKNFSAPATAPQLSTFLRPFISSF
jgi:hypothetical protein